MSDEKLIVDPGAASLAAYFLSSSLMMRLIEKGVVTADEGNEIAAGAASLCRGNGVELAAQMIENTIPTCVGVDSVEAARLRGHTITGPED